MVFKTRGGEVKTIWYDPLKDRLYIRRRTIREWLWTVIDVDYYEPTIDHDDIKRLVYIVNF